ncbi:MAG: ARPP-1 family domain-containing protein [Promethearchaeota archaeon]
MTTSKLVRDFAKNVLDEENFSLGNAIPVENVIFVPILKEETSREERDYLTIEEALNENVLKIVDKGTEIAHLIVTNEADLPVLIEEGEVFEGQGTQDRIVVGSVIIQPKTTIEIPVKCVHAPHPLATNAQFRSSSGKGSRSMLRKMRSMKYQAAQSFASTARISQGEVWDSVAEETATENVRDSSRYKEAMDERSKRAKARKIEFPKNTIGFIAVSEEDKLLAMELHRTPRAFKRRKDSIIVSVEKELKEGVKPISKEQASKRSREVLQELASIDEEQVQTQIEVDGLLLNLAGGMQGEYTVNKFYSASCPKCGAKKPRVEVCPECGFEEEVADRLMHFSL